MTSIWRRGGHEITIFPRCWFLPYLWDELERGGESFPNAYAVHHWRHRRELEEVPCPA